MVSSPIHKKEVSFVKLQKIAKLASSGNTAEAVHAQGILNKYEGRAPNDGDGVGGGAIVDLCSGCSLQPSEKHAPRCDWERFLISRSSEVLQAARYYKIASDNGWDLAVPVKFICRGKESYKCIGFGPNKKVRWEECSCDDDGIYM